MGKIPIKKLIESCVTWMRNSGYTEYTIGVYDRLWRHGISSFMTRNGLSDFTEDIGLSFLEECHTDGFLKATDIQMRRSVKVLIEFQKNRCIARKSHPKAQYDFTGEIGQAMEQAVKSCAERGSRENTINIYRRHLWRFQSYLNRIGVKSLSDLTHNHIVGYVDGYGHGDKDGAIHVLRYFLSRIWEKKYTSTNLKEVLYPYRKSKTEKTPSYYSAEEIALIENEAKDNCNTAKGRRNYAMLLLATRLGLRASDIAALSFDNILWDRMEITLTMYKTGKMITLPLLPEIGNAIIHYVQNGRPIVESRKIFISAKAPYEDATTSVVQYAIRSIIEDSGVDISNRHHGSHAMRHSLATRLLENGETIPVISATLGHQSTVTTMGYLRVDLHSLTKCALEVSNVPEEFYKRVQYPFHES